MEFGGLAEKEAVGQRATDTLVKEDEHESDADAFVGEPVGIAVAVPLE